MDWHWRSARENWPLSAPRGARHAWSQTEVSCACVATCGMLPLVPLAGIDFWLSPLTVHGESGRNWDLHLGLGPAPHLNSRSRWNAFRPARSAACVYSTVAAPNQCHGQRPYQDIRAYRVMLLYTAWWVMSSPRFPGAGCLMMSGKVLLIHVLQSFLAQAKAPDSGAPVVITADLLLQGGPRRPPETVIVSPPVGRCVWHPWSRPTVLCWALLGLPA